MTLDTNKFYTYDIETYKNIFTCVTKHFVTGEIFIHEWSERRNNIPDFLNFLNYLKACNATMVGFNNCGFDWTIVHRIMERYPTGYTIEQMFQHVQELTNTSWDQRFNNIIWKPLIRQMDLLKINHFDNAAKATSLKMLEFNMRSGNIQDLPYEPGSVITLDQIDPLIQYNINDVNETEKFLKECVPAIELRADLSKKFGKDFTNHNDTKIGKDYFIMELEKSQPGICFYRDENNRKKPCQTPRDSIALGDVIFPYTRFEHPEFQKIHRWFNERVITETKGSIENLSCTIDGFRFDFGTGGIHGSIDPAVVESDDDDVILDIDVASYYPNLAIANKIFPEHLSEKFCEIYEFIYNERKKYPKGTPENMVFKLALNGTYGDSNNRYSPFYDPKFTMGITINGQLSLCMLAEQMMKTPGLKMIQINTDGLTFKVPRGQVEHTRSICRWWEGVTGLELEEAVYSRVWIRDVNNYTAETADTGKVKLKGKYGYKLGWHQNHSSLVVQKAAKAFLVDGIEPTDFLRDHDDVMDFFLRTKVPRTSRLILGAGGNTVHSEQHFTHETPLQNITRYYISNAGGSLIKIMPPLPKQLAINPNAPERRFKINAGWKVTPCNDIRGMSDFDINHQWYLEEVEKLISYAR